MEHKGAKKITLSRILRFAFSAFLLMFWVDATAQDNGHTVTGTVIDADSRDPLPGVTILIEGTEIGTTTNLDGDFEIELPSPNEILFFSYVGFSEQTVDVDGRTELSVALEPDIYMGEEVVMVGYGRQRE